MTNEDTPIPGPLNNVIRIDDERIKGHLDRVVRGTVEGMPAEVFIKTGQRTFFEYLVKPVRDTMSRAFRES